MYYYLGIDPGLHGAVALFNLEASSGRTNFILLESIFDMPIMQHGKKKALDVEELYSLFMKWKFFSIRTAFIENVFARPGQGVSSMFSFGYQKGVLIGMARAFGWKIELLTPLKWKKSMGLLKQDKSASLKTAIKLFPEEKEYFKRVKDNGRADAALICYSGLISQ